jgi:hypothetical protein
VLNETSKLVTVRGGSGTNDDTISISRSGNTISVSVDPTLDVGGTGELPGAGNLPAWVTEYDISQVSSITIDAAAGNDSITIANDIGVPITINGNTGTDTITVNETAPATPVTVTNSAGDDVINVNTDNTGFAEVRFNSTMTLGALNVGNGGLANLVVDGTRAIVSKAVSVNGTGKIDLNNNDMIVDYTGTTPLPALQQLIQIARAGGAWTNGGITSTSAKNANPKSTTLGIMESLEFKNFYGAAATFAGQAIDNDAVLIKYTYYGDTDFNGTVNFDDYSRTDAGYNQARSGWTNGDFDGNGVVDFDDYSLIDLAFNTQSGTLRPTRVAPPGKGSKSL